MSLSVNRGWNGGQATPDTSARTVEQVRLASAVCTDCVAREFRVSSGVGCEWSGARWVGWLTDDVVLWAQRSQLDPVPVDPEAFDHDILDVHRRCTVCGEALQHATPGGEERRVNAHQGSGAWAPRSGGVRLESRRLHRVGRGSSRATSPSSRSFHPCAASSGGRCVFAPRGWGSTSWEAVPFVCVPCSHQPPAR